MTVDDQEARIAPQIQYQLKELEIALDPSRPEHILPSLSTARVGVVDVGCGIGQLFVAKANELAPGVPCHGFDIDPALIAYANQNWPDRGRFEVCGAEKLPLPDGSVDVYVSRVALPYTDIRCALDEAARVLVPRGRLWVTLHPLSMTWGELVGAMREGRFREMARRIVVLLNGLAFHLFGTSRRLLGVRDSWQSASRMTRELQQNFTDIRIGTGRHFLVEATRR
jgi:SAM-dependent methyltransferase